MAEIFSRKLQENLLDMGTVLVAFSGGVDSTLLLKAAVKILGRRNVLAVTATSEVYPAAEIDNACKIAKLIGARHIIIETIEMKNELFVENSPQRCYHCKTGLFRKLKAIADEKGLKWVVDGSNADDTGDYRPGIRAARELGVRSPLQEAGLSKSEIRQACRQLGLPNWDKPAMPCLSSRIPYGQRITSRKLRQIEEAEAFLRSLGIKDLRVRHHGNLARIEVPVDTFKRFLADNFRTDIVRHFETLGFIYVSIDLKGFRSGSFNEILPEETRYGQ